LAVSPRDTALIYAAPPYNWPVFPVSADGQKRPLVKDWPNVASTDPAQIEAFWRRFPRAFVAIPTGPRSGVVVLDVDC
jgi:hypothetical protein